MVGLFFGFAFGILCYWFCFRRFCKRRARERWIGEIEKKYEKIQKRKLKKDSEKISDQDADSMEDRKSK